MDEKDIERLKELESNSGKTSNRIIKEAFCLLSIRELGKVKFVIIFLLSLLLSFLISMQFESQLIISKIAEMCQTVALAIFGITFTAYSIFQALLSPKLLYIMVRANDNEDENISSFSSSNKYFISYMMLSFIIIVSNISIILCNIIIPNGWNLFQNRFINNFIFFTVCFPYFYISIGWLIEMKSVITNIHNMYNVTATDKYIEELNQSKK